LWEDRWWNLADTTSGAGGIGKVPVFGESMEKLRGDCASIVAAEAAIQVASRKMLVFPGLSFARSARSATNGRNGPAA